MNKRNWSYEKEINMKMFVKISKIITNSLVDK